MMIINGKLKDMKKKQKVRKSNEVDDGERERDEDSDDNGFSLKST